MKIFPMKTELFHADGQTEGRTVITNLIVIFHDFTRAPSNKRNFPKFGTIYDLSLATSIECHGKENGKTHQTEYTPKLFFFYFVICLQWE